MLVIFDDEKIRSQSKLYKGKRGFLWLPLFTIDPGANNFIGISDSFVWVCGKENSLYEVVDPKAGFLLVPVLRQDLVFFVSDLKKNLFEKKIPDCFLKKFPFDSLVLSGVMGRGEDVNGAYRWISQGYPVNQRIARCFSDRGLRVPAVSDMNDKDRLDYVLSLSS